MSFQMNSLSRILWLLLNFLFGAPLAYTLFHWTACNMQMPLIIKDLVSTYLPFLNPIFNVPYVRIESISSSILAKILFNGFLYAIFGFVHTFFAQEPVQNFLRQKFFPSEILRTVYCVLTTITSFIIMGFWQHTDIQLWDLLPSAMNQYQRDIILLCCYHLICLPGIDSFRVDLLLINSTFYFLLKVRVLSFNLMYLNLLELNNYSNVPMYHQQNLTNELLVCQS